MTPYLSVVLQLHIPALGKATTLNHGQIKVTDFHFKLCRLFIGNEVNLFLGFFILKISAIFLTCVSKILEAIDIFFLPVLLRYDWHIPLYKFTHTT